MKICELLGVQLLEPFVVEGPPECYDVFYGVIDAAGVMRHYHKDEVNPVGNKMKGNKVCWVINHPECVKPMYKFSHQEVIDAMMLQRLVGDHWRWQIHRKDTTGLLILYDALSDSFIKLLANWFPGIKPGESFTLNGIIERGVPVE